MKALILIGGLGTRLRPLTCHTPKPLLPIVNRPFLEYQFALLKRHGIREVILCVAYLPHTFEDYFGDGRKWGLKLRYVHEKEPLGTGGAIRNADRYLDEPTIIFNGDIMTDIDLSGMCRYHQEKKALVTIGLSRVKDPTIYGLVETAKDGKIEKFVEEPSWDEVTCNTINAGIYVFDPEVIKLIPEGVNFSVERGLFPNLLTQGYGVYGFVYKGYWLDIGTIEKYMQAHRDMMERSINFDLPGAMRQDNLWVGAKFRQGKNISLCGRLVCGKNVTLGDAAQVQGNVSLGNNVVVGKGVYLADCVVLDDTRIEDGVRIENALVGKGCVIEANAAISAETALGNGTRVSRFSKL